MSLLTVMTIKDDYLYNCQHGNFSLANTLNVRGIMLYVCVYLFFCIHMIKMSYSKSIYYVKAEGCIKPVLNFTMVANLY